MHIRKSTAYMMITSMASLLLGLLIGVHPLLTKNDSVQRLEAGRQTVVRLSLTDICLFTEASYTRHPNMADRFVPFQDHPGAAAHFPSESILPPPYHLTRGPLTGRERGAP